MAKAKTTTQLVLSVTRRTEHGKRPVKRMRRTGVIPGVVYGRDTKPLPISVKARELGHVLHSKAGEHALITLRVEGDHGLEKPTLVKAIQHDPVDGHVVHIDFHAIVLTERLRIKVPVVLKGEPEGVKQEGGVLEHFLREVEVECLPTEIPEAVEFDVSALKIGDTIHVRDLVPPARATITSDPEGAIASVQEHKEEKPEEAAAAVVTEPEVIREKKEEGEEAAPGEGEKKEKAEAGESKSEK